MMTIRRRYSKQDRTYFLSEYHRLREQGVSIQSTARRIGINYNTLYKWVQDEKWNKTLDQVRSSPPSDRPNPFPTNSFLPMTILSGLGFSS